MTEICIIGTGYVGLVTGACLEHLRHKVACVDKHKSKVAELRQGNCPIHEQGLERLLQKAQKLEFTTNLKQAASQSEIIFICVGTPEKEDGDADLSHVFEVCEQISAHIDGKTVVIKSTLPITAIPDVRKILDSNSLSYDLVSNPEFLSQGTAVKDFLEPDRIVIGSDSDKGFDSVASLFQEIDAPVIKTDIASAIMIKYASNAFLATKVSFVNSIARLCEKVGANINDVANGMGYDKRIGKLFLKAGVGFGGSCFPKDTRALVKTGSKLGVELEILKAVDGVNTFQRQLVIEKLKRHLGDLDGKQVSLLGLSYKPGTDDLREAPALYLARDLLNLNTRINAFDPIIKQVDGFDGKLAVKEEAYQAVKDADAIIFVTEHPEFSLLDFARIKELAKGNIIIDGRNFLNGSKLKEAGFIYEGIGI